MMRHYLPCPPGLRLATLLLGLAAATAALADGAMPASDNAVASVELAPAPPPHGSASVPASGGNAIGSATEGLLAMQRNAIGARPRPIDGEQASRSYQRYLKSFETSIPEHYGTGLDLKKR